VIVVDASAVIELLFRSPTGDHVARRIADATETLHAPHILDLEVTQVLRRYLAAGQLDETRARDAFEDFMSLDVVRYSHDVLLPRVWELRHNCTAYDAAYLALAETLAAPLLTCDRALAAISGCTATVEVV
jgi:predicted nucleic acid-binding protein